MSSTTIGVIVALAGSVALGQDDPADTAYINGRIYTVNEARPWAEAVAIRDGKFLAVGSNEDVQAVSAQRTAVIDLAGKFVVPGMIDVHTHGIENHLPSAIKLSNGDDLDLILRDIRAYLDAHPGQGWVRFVPFGFGMFPGDNGPKEILDTVAPDRPIVIEHQSGHAYWANSKALELAGITKDTPDPHQGIIVRDEEGEPAGGLQESAMQLIRKALPPISADDIRQSAKTAMGLFAAHGVTATREAGIWPARLDVLEQLEAEGRLRTRFSVASHWRTTLTDIPPDDDFVKAWLAEHAGKGSDVLKLDCLKIFVDGVPASHTALLKEPYTDRPDTRGMQLIASADLNETLIDYDRNGVATIMHVLGDEASKVALDAVEAARGANGNSGLRHHLSHSIILDRADFRRYSELGVVVDFSPFFAYPGPHHDNHEKGLGPERLQQWYPVRSLMDLGVPVALATDYPVDQLNPFVHMESAHTRKHPYGDAPGRLGGDEAISREQAIKAYTLNPAYILGWDDRIGSIEAGKLADMVILDQNLLEIAAADMSETRVLATVFSGEVIYEADEGALSRAEAEAIRVAALEQMRQSNHPCALCAHGWEWRSRRQ